MHLTIRQITQEDVIALMTISRQTFYDTFHHNATKENMADYLDTRYDKDKLLNEINHPNSVFYFVYETNNDSPIGYIKLNWGTAQSESFDTTAFEIERIYVLKEYHSYGVGQYLMDFALDYAQTHGFTRVWLGVWEHNERALRFYFKNGFVRFSEHTFTIGQKPQTDWLLEKHLPKTA